MKRIEASTEEWADLYQLGTFLQEMEPWRDYWDTDLIALNRPGQAEPVYCSILGMAGQTFGVVFYQGQSGLDRFNLMMYPEASGVPAEYGIMRMNNLSINWGDRDEVSRAQYKIIRELGYKYRGHNNWMYFLSQKDGFYPFLPDRDEVLRLTDHAEALIAALEYQKTWQLPVNFDRGEIFHFTWAPLCKDRKGRSIMPNRGYTMEMFEVDDRTAEALRAQAATPQVLEVDLVYLMTGVLDPDYDRPRCPMVAMLGDHQSKMVLEVKLDHGKKDPQDSLVIMLINWILSHGRPRRIITRNRLVGALISDVCRVCGIRQEWQPRLTVLGEFVEQMTGFEP